MRKATLSAALLTIVCAASLGAHAHAQLASVEEVIWIATPKQVVVAEKKPVEKAKEEPAAVPAPVPVTVEVMSGDTLITIAESHQTTYGRLFDANTQIANPNLINSGDVLRIPFADESLAHRDIPTAPVVIAVSASSARQYSTAAPVVANGDVWDQLAACESHANWAINTGNGYYGGLQFSSGTWLGNGGGAYADRADQASREQQIDIASRVQAGRGWAPWPACARILGLL